MLCRIVGRRFSVYPNQRQLLSQVIGGREIKFDYHIHEYDKCIQAYLLRRRIKKEEIAAKIYIIEPLAGVDLSSQILSPMKSLYDLPKMTKLHESGIINTQYLISKLQEDYFKQVMDEYVAKLPINGYVVPFEMHQQFEKMRNDIVTLYRWFFFGDEDISVFERETEFRYLMAKQVKHRRYQAKNTVRFKCAWTTSNQRSQELMRNWQGRNLQLYDDFSPIYEGLHLEQKEEINSLTESINGGQYVTPSNVTHKILSFLLERGTFSKSSKRRLEVSATVLLIRTMLTATSIEFTNLMGIPADFHIEHAILNMHVWLLSNRLEEINTPTSKFFARQMLVALKRNQLQSISRIHLKKKNDFIKDISHYMQANRNAFHSHVHLNPYSKTQIYRKLDALIWSTVFFEKVPRYSHEVYMMADYFKQHLDYLSTCTFSDFEQALIEFDAYRVDPDYIANVQAHSPRISEEAFQEEFHSTKTEKSYYYTFQSSEETEFLRSPSSAPSPATKNVIPPPTIIHSEDLPINREEGMGSSLSKSVKSFIDSFNKTVYKYQTLRTFDYMNDLQKQTDEAKKKTKKYAFMQSPEEQATTEIDSLDPDFIKKVRYQRSKETNNQDPIHKDNIENK